MILTVEREDLEVFSFIIGAVFGSFLNVLIIRLPQNISIVRPRSYCPKCNNTILWYNNIPIISFFLLKGKCSFCNEKISKQYPLVEVLSAIITLVLFIKLGLSLALFFAFNSFLYFNSLILY